MWRSRVVLNIAIALVLVPVYFGLHELSWEQRAEVRRSAPPGYTLPAEFSRVLAFGYQGLLSDYQFLRTVTFYGDRFVMHERMTEEDWDFFARSLQAVTELDPYFLDPYVLAEGLLTWEARRFDQANALLGKGMRHRDWDWRLPYYIGFNYFYFLKDYATGSRYLMQAAEIPGSPAYLNTLAARIAYYGGKSNTALLFLQQMLAQSNSEALKKRMAKRLLALQHAVRIEAALQQYRNANNGANPSTMSDLVTHGYLDTMPPDPYGGTWGILKNGRVFSTSKFVELKKGQP